MRSKENRIDAKPRSLKKQHENRSETVYRVMKHYNKLKHSIPLIYVKLYTSSSKAHVRNERGTLEPSGVRTSKDEVELLHSSQR